MRTDLVKYVDLGIYFGQKFFLFLFFLIFASFLIFIITDLLPGDTAQFILGTEASAETLQSLREELNLHLAWYQRYFFWIKGLLQGDWGKSYILNLDVKQLFLERLSLTLPLIFLSLFLSLALAYFLSFVVVYFQKNWLDWGIMSLLQLGIALPSFWIASLLIIFFSVQLGWLPVGNFLGWDFSSLSGFFISLKYLVLPLLSLILPQTAIFTRIIRSSLIEAATENFIKTAQSKGLSPFKILLKHIFPYAQIPIITIVGLQIPLLITGVVLIEYVFFLPGMGRLILQAIHQRDLILVKNAVLLLILLVSSVNLITQWIILILNPDRQAADYPIHHF